ncbi:hypothetical protein QTP86_019477, partial [Hemibagrus guttatus]
YRPLVRRSKPVLKQVKTWPAGAISALQDCFECTDWNMFREAATNGDSINLEEYTTSVTSYIGKCIDDVTVSKPVDDCRRSAFNTIIPQHLIKKLRLLGLNTSLCNWILDFLTGRPQSVRIGNSLSSTTTLSTGAPQGCVLSPLLFTLLTHDCAAMHSSNHIVKFTDDTTVVGLISKNDESAYREEVQRLTAWCKPTA